MIHYGMTKTAQIAVARGFAEETRGTGVTINTLLPGPTKSEGVFTFMEQMAKQEGKDLATIEKDFFKFAGPPPSSNASPRPKKSPRWQPTSQAPLPRATTGAAVRVDGGVVQAAF